VCDIDGFKQNQQKSSFKLHKKFRICFEVFALNLFILFETLRSFTCSGSSISCARTFRSKFIFGACHALIIY